MNDNEIRLACLKIAYEMRPGLPVSDVLRVADQLLRYVLTGASKREQG